MRASALPSEVTFARWAHFRRNFGKRNKEAMRFFTPELMRQVFGSDESWVSRIMAQTQLDNARMRDVWAKSSLSCRNDSRNCSIGTIFMTHESSIILSRGTATPGRSDVPSREQAVHVGSQSRKRSLAVVLDGSLMHSMPVTVIAPSFVPIARH